MAPKVVHLIGEQNSLNESQVMPALAPMSENERLTDCGIWDKFMHRRAPVSKHIFRVARAWTSLHLLLREATSISGENCLAKDTKEAK